MPYFPNAATHAEHAVTAERTAPDTMRQGPRRDPTPKKFLTLKPGTLLLCHGPCAVQFSRPPAPLGRLGSGRKTPERQSSTRWTTVILGLRFKYDIGHTSNAQKATFLLSTHAVNNNVHTPGALERRHHCITEDDTQTNTNARKCASGRLHHPPRTPTACPSERTRD